MTLTAIVLTCVLVVAIVGWLMTLSVNYEDNGIVFKEPKVRTPGGRLGDYRRKRAAIERDKPEGNNVDWAHLRGTKLIEKGHKCDHLYFPVERDGELIGQECRLCGQFNTAAEVLARIAPFGARSLVMDFTPVSDNWVEQRFLDTDHRA